MLSRKCTYIEINHVADQQAVEFWFGDDTVLLVSCDALPPEPVPWGWRPDRAEIRLRCPLLKPRANGVAGINLTMGTRGASADLASTSEPGLYKGVYRGDHIPRLVYHLLESSGPESGSIPVDEPGLVRLFYYG